MVNAFVEPQSPASTASYEASTSAQGNWAADWRGDTTNRYRSALPFTFDITKEFEFADFEQAMSPLLTRLAEVLPKRMSKTYVKQLQARFPQSPATDDPVTYEFETHRD